MKKTLLAFIAGLILAASTAVFASERLTAEAFQKIAISPSDSVPLRSELAKAQPLWRKSQIVIICTYSNGRSTTEKLPMSAKTVEGKYIVFSIPSEIYRKQIDSIMSYDSEAHTVKIWGFYDGVVTEGTLVYDSTKHIYSAFSQYSMNGNFAEMGVGFYSDTEISDHTLVIKDGVLFMVRDTKNTPSE